MLTSFMLTMALAAPVPVAPPAAAPGPVPRLVEVKAADGKVTIDVLRVEKQKVQVGVAIGGAPGAAAPAVATREISVQKIVGVELSAVKDLAVTTADGKKVDVEDAVKRLKGGGTVVVSADGKPVSPHHLKLFKDDVLVLASPELVAPVVGPGVVRPGVRPLPPVQVQPQPAPAPQLLPANPGGIQLQIQVQPGGVQVIPLPAAPAPQK